LVAFVALIVFSSIPPSADDSEAARVIASLRDKLKAQSAEIENLHSKLTSAAKEHEAEVRRESSYCLRSLELNDLALSAQHS
jgi:predicted RNase H-like nuclease (RuvC/YqgF family)